MAFMGMVFAGIFLIIFATLLFLSFAFGVTALILGIVARKKDSRKLRIVRNVFIVLFSLAILPVALVVGYLAFTSTHVRVTLPDGETAYIRTAVVREFTELCEDGSAEALEDMEDMLRRNKKLVYWRDVNRKGVLEYGLFSGNADMVRLALSYGAVFDDPTRYDHMSYVDNSMEEYINGIIGRSITEDDIEIIELMFENGASTEYDGRYEPFDNMNMLGNAAWSVLYNDERVTDTELSFIQVFIDNGVSKNCGLILIEEVPSNFSFSSDDHFDVPKDDNYYALLNMVGR